MIHSLSGGVIADNEMYTFAKVRTQDAPYWYIAPFKVEAGDLVLVPTPNGNQEGTVERVEYHTPQTAPVSPKRAREILCLLAKKILTDPHKL